jgi:hypothetical protein
MWHICSKCGISAVNDRSTQPFGFENSEGNDCLAEERSARICELFLIISSNLILRNPKLHQNQRKSVHST